MFSFVRYCSFLHVHKLTNNYMTVLMYVLPSVLFKEEKLCRSSVCPFVCLPSRWPYPLGIVVLCLTSFHVLVYSFVIVMYAVLQLQLFFSLNCQCHIFNYIHPVVVVWNFIFPGVWGWWGGGIVDINHTMCPSVHLSEWVVSTPLP